MLAACGGSSPAPSPPSITAAATPTPVPSPVTTSGPPPAAAVDAVREFWTLVGSGRIAEAQQTVVAPGAPVQSWDGTDIGGARFVRLIPGSVGGAPVVGATVEFAVDVWIKPAGSASPWGEAGVHELFENVVRMSDGSWRLVESGTGP